MKCPTKVNYAGSMRNILNHQETLCWSCVNALKRCPWSISFEPVVGWDAVPTKVKAASSKYEASFFVRDCPMFEADSPEEYGDEDSLATRDWTLAEVERAIALHRKGRTYEEIGRILGKSERSVKAKMCQWYEEAFEAQKAE